MLDYVMYATLIVGTIAFGIWVFSTLDKLDDDEE